MIIPAWFESDKTQTVFGFILDPCVVSDSYFGFCIKTISGNLYRIIQINPNNFTLNLEKYI